MYRKIVNFFDKLEDKVRATLSKTPILYTFIGAFAIVLFWKGVWDTADLFPFLFGPVSIIISVSILLVTGLFVSFFVGDVIIISGLKKEKKIIEKTEIDVKEETISLREIKNEVMDIKQEIKKDNVSLKEVKEEMDEIKSILDEKIIKSEN